VPPAGDSSSVPTRPRPPAAGRRRGVGRARSGKVPVGRWPFSPLEPRPRIARTPRTPAGRTAAPPCPSANTRATNVDHAACTARYGTVPSGCRRTRGTEISCTAVRGHDPARGYRPHEVPRFAPRLRARRPPGATRPPTHVANAPPPRPPHPPPDPLPSSPRWPAPAAPRPQTASSPPPPPR
jgi:hypothetical protein